MAPTAASVEAETEAATATATATAEPEPTATSSPTAVPATATATAHLPEVEETASAPAAPAAAEATGEDLLLGDDFRDSGSGWPTAQSFDNYYIGYHEPEWYHVEIQAANEYAPVVLEGQSFDDVVAEAEMFVETALSADSGDYRYGLVLRRAGRQFYAFTISPRTGTWAVLKSSPASLEVVDEGSSEVIRGPEEADTLRVDAVGSTFTFHVNGEVVSELQDGDYGSGELGFFVETFDSPRVHVHYDTLRVAVPRDESVLLSDDFQDSGSGWPSARSFDNYYIGYHEPEWYHVEVQAANEYAPVVLEGQAFDDVTAEAEIFVENSLSADSGDFRYGLAMRRSGRQFYAFTVNPRRGEWAVLKSSPTSLTVLAEGSDDSIRGLEAADTLRVDAAGSRFLFHVNGNVVADLQDGDYTSGELGFFVQTFDSPRAHIHYDSLSIREVDAPAPLCTVITSSLNLRPGPGTAYAPPLRALPEGTRLIPRIRSGFPPWIQVEIADSGQTGWVYAATPYASCNFDISDLPLP